MLTVCTLLGTVRNRGTGTHRIPEGRRYKPVREWLASLDKATSAIVDARINRLAGGNFGDAKAVGGGVIELRIHAGAGYRVYVARKGRTIVILLCGASKRTQKADIKLAQKYWSDYGKR